MTITYDNLEQAATATETNGAATSSTPVAPDPFDPARLRLTQNFAAVGVKKVLMSVPVRKPDKAWFVQVHPDEAYRVNTAVIELKESREMYLVDQKLWSALAAEPTFGPRALFTAINRQGVVFVWPIRLPGADGKIDEWSRTALASATRAIGRWVRVTANIDCGAYDLAEAVGDLPAPEWPDMPFSDLLRLAFKSNYIDTLDHPTLRMLRGEA